MAVCYQGGWAAFSGCEWKAPMGNLGFGEILLILVVLLLVFGTSRLPALGDAVGKGLRNFRKATKDEASPGETKAGEPPELK